MIQKQLVDKLALKILEGEFGEGDTVRVDAAEGELVFERATAPSPRRRTDRAAAGRGESETSEVPLIHDLAMCSYT